MKKLEHYANIRIMVKHDAPVFNRSFSQVAEEYATMQRRRDEFTLEEYRKLHSVGRK